MIALAGSFLLLNMISWLLQYSLQPSKIRPNHREFRLWILDNVIIFVPFLVILLLTQRFLLATLGSLALLITIYIINQAKHKALREPLVFSDFYLYLQIFTHPRLFLPFLNVPLTLAAIAAGIVALVLILIFEPASSLPNTPLVIALAAFIGFTWHCVESISLKHEAIEDVKELGLFNSLLVSSLQAIRKHRLAAFHEQLQTQSPYAFSTNQLNTHTESKAADIIVVQSESFCDIRSIHPSIKDDVLEQYNRICEQAVAYGPLTVPAWGANTLRTEFAFLSGIDNNLLAHYRYNPYQFIHSPLPTLASKLKQQGYHTICIHPNHIEFFKRNRVYPLLGFDEFLDIQAFEEAHKEGPYISDQAVTDKLLDLLNHRPSDKPLFIFVITMENHGPLHLESYDQEDIQAIYSGQPPQHHHDLTIYLKHLKNADRMLHRITDYLSNCQIETDLCWYGDHVPSMPAVYEELNVEHLDSHYMIWNNRQRLLAPKQKTISQRVEIASLGQHLFGSVKNNVNIF